MKHKNLQVLLLESDYTSVSKLMDELIKINNIESIYYGSNYIDGIKLLDDVLPDIIFLSLDLSKNKRNQFLEKIEILSPNSKLIIFSKKINPISLMANENYSIIPERIKQIQLN